ncbi:regulator of G-protein signaling 21-like [Notechis scutatus]|uniref:Regulator of G-protein signaling 21-like n=1 Tax=Notechis scutatus TaxID=8663 RepID=A0A6J1U1Y7_9SAUR|nr:regulator of G-protein signaling 21-like [Notechis scutatus]
MENPLVLSSQLNSASRVKTLCKIMKSLNREGAKPDTGNRSLEKRNRLSYSHKSELHPNMNFDKFEQLAKASSETPETVKKWAESFDQLISHKDGLDAFRTFLKSEFSEENIEFWLACEDLKKTKSAAKIASKAQRIYSEFIQADAPQEINIDFNTRDRIMQAISKPTLNCFDDAQKLIYNLMVKDSFPRFLKSEAYKELVNKELKRSQKRWLPFL